MILLLFDCRRRLLHKMASETDFQLLRQFAKEHSEDAFKSLADRYLNLVYSVALSRLASDAAAKDITQVVFAALASKAGHLSDKVILSGWLFQVTTHACQDLKRGEARRKKWESEAVQQQITEAKSNSLEINDIEPVIGSALASLSTTERDAILLRFFGECDFQQVGARLGISEAAAKMRVARGLERLRNLLGKRGVTVSEAALCGAFPHMILCAPAGLGAGIKSSAMGHTALSTSNSARLKGVLKTMIWTKTRTGIVIGAAVLLAAPTTVVITHRMAAATTSSTVSKVNLDEYIGRFEMAGHTLDFQKYGGGIAAMVEGRPGFVAYPESEGKFVSHDQNSVTELSFARDASGQITQVTLVRDGRKLGDLKRANSQ